MKSICQLLLVVIFAVILALPVSAQQFATRGKKLIEYGWDVRTPSFIKDNIDKLEQYPFDGVAFRLNYNLAFDTKAWTDKDLKPDLDAVKAIKWKKFTGNFLIMYSANDVGMSWFNDAQWKIILNNAAKTAKIARKANCAGIIFDPEPYGKDPWALTDYTDKDYAVVAAQVRKRGCQWIKALERDWPDMKLLLFFFSPDQNNTLGAFCNGLIEGAKGNVKIIDGNENSYYHTSYKGYIDDWKRMTENGQARIDPKLKNQFKKHFQAGMALYMDQSLALRVPGFSYISYYMTPEDRLKYFEHSVYWAMKTTDEYVWCYSERLNWWDAMFPRGADEAIRSARKKLENGQGLGFSFEAIVRKASQDRDTAIAKNLKQRTADITSVPQGTKAPVIDGKLDDEVWSKIQPLEEFVPPATLEDAKVDAKTTAWVTYDDTNIYMAYKCDEPKMGNLAIAGTIKDSDIWRGDTLEIFISTGSDSPYAYKHFMVNPGNAQWDGSAPPDGNDVAWNADWKSAVVKNANSWDIEIAIPWSAIGGKPAAGDIRYANICRQRMPQPEWSSWSSVIEGFLDAARFGKWVFKG